MSEEKFYKHYFDVSHLPNQKRREEVWRVVAGYLRKKFIPKGARVLDLGAGYGPFINTVDVKEKYAIDRSPVLKERANKDIKVFIQDVTSLANFKDNFFGTVFASNLLEHLERREIGLLLPEVRRVLVPGGRFILLQPNFAYAYKQYFDDYTHKQIFTHISMRDMLQAFDFSVEKIFPKFMPYSMRSKFPTAPWIVRLYLASPIKPMAGQMLIVAKK